MTTPLARMPKPGAQQYRDARKVFLVPTYMLSPDAPEDGQDLLERYWSEVRDHIENLERTLGKVAHVYHEAVYTGGEDGMGMVESMNPKGVSFVRALCHSEAMLESTDDRELLEESTDWQRCISIGLMSTRVMDTAVERFRAATDGRYEHIGKRIDETLKEGESGILFIRPDHRVQFPEDVRVFYVAPPAQDAFKRWIDDQMRATAEVLERRAQQSEEPQEAGPQAGEPQDEPRDPEGA